MRRAAGSGQLSPILGALTEPRDALTVLIDAYVATSFANPELPAVYHTERVNLPPADRLLCCCITPSGRRSTRGSGC
ncbi:hypothetical protein MLAC_37460 [Mycobacterium lacus]|uniref:Uncharacterized protein n=1 Tax=Mycobacterium lacus TaxID=169765 RepID=A0A7I7NPB4_9MYCO|nr:hypothetical protein MLAC_37460 [Mycobacterium lacus]